jgi:putative drug exporter of the RND superfamily
VLAVESPFDAGSESRISPDDRTAYADIRLDKEDNEFTVEEAKALVEPILAAGGSDLRVEVGGAVAKLSQTAPVGSEAIGLAAAAVILLLVVGSAVATGLPLVTALFGLGIALALGELLRRVVHVPDWAPATAALVGLGVGIDYALFIVTRYRTGLASGLEPRAATLTAVVTAGRAVLFAGTTVIISMLGILLIGQPALTGFAVSVVVAVLVIMLASVPLLPAVLALVRPHR